MHPKNRFSQSYDMPHLVKVNPDLAPFIYTTPKGNLSVPFTDAKAVKALNKALLMDAYGLENWVLPDDSLCPPVPGRADYLLYAADLLAAVNKGKVPTGGNITVCDLGTGASLIYPIIGVGEWKWKFIATDIGKQSFANAQAIVDSNLALKGRVDCRVQKNPMHHLRGILLPGELVELVITNPPFYNSEKQMEEMTGRKQKNLQLTPEEAASYGGTNQELWCYGGEIGYVIRMIEESVQFADQVMWFTSLVSRKDSLKPIVRQLKRENPAAYKIIDFGQGQKTARFVAWTFHKEDVLQKWSKFWAFKK
ncbi:MAG: 23S rRNA (adenine(1618)-N(6))-methyltransferase RlmF [Flavobacteriales bacterium]